MEIWEPKPPGTLWATPGLLQDCFFLPSMPTEYTVEQLVESLHYKPEGQGYDSQWGHCDFSLTESFWSHYDPGVNSASKRNGYQEYFLGVQAAGAQG
jgi:hypothetical protein